MAGVQPCRWMRWAAYFWLCAVPFDACASASDGTGASHRGMGVAAMSEAHNRSLLIEYFKAFVNDRDLDSFRSHVRRDTAKEPSAGFSQTRTT